MDGLMIALIIFVSAICLFCLTCFVALLVDSIRRGYQDGTISGGVVTLLFTGVLAFVIYMCIYTKAEYAKSYNILVHNIVSLERDTGVYGSFVLGSGVVQDRPVYYYYYQVKENTYTLGSLHGNKNKIYIVETDEHIPSIYKIKDANTNPDSYYYNIYVPFNTVVVSYTV